MAYPSWDYHPHDIIVSYPVLNYYFPNPKFKTYQVKAYWKDTNQTDGYIFIMDNKDRPHQGACLNRIFIQDSIIQSSFHPLTAHEIQLYDESDFPSIHN